MTAIGSIGNFLVVLCLILTYTKLLDNQENILERFKNFFFQRNTQNILFRNCGFELDMKF